MILAWTPVTGGASGTGEHRPAWLIGNWVGESENCESDAGVRYNADGSWSAYGSAGTWKLDGSRLVIRTTSRWEIGGETDLPGRSVHVQQVEVLGPDLFRSRWQDGTQMTLRRCPD